MTPKEALHGLQVTIQNQGPDTPNRHYGRNQYTWLLECCDTLSRAITDTPEPRDMLGLLHEMAQFDIEEAEDTDELVAAWLTADDITSRLRSRLQELHYWWDTVPSS